MTEFLHYNLHVALLLAAFYMFWRLLLARETLHRLNRVVLLLVAGLSFVLPLCVITLHKTVWIAAQPIGSTAQPAAVTTETGSASTPLWLGLAAGVYVAGAVLTLGHSVLSIVKVRRLIGRCERHRQPDGTVVAVSSDERVQPFSWMHFIVMNRSDYEQHDAAILAHERGHISAHHSWDVLLCDALTPMQWFNPAVWMLRSDLRALHEFEADQAVLSQGINARQYQYLLVRKAVATQGYSVANRLSHSTLKRRISMMTQRKSSRKSRLKALYMIPVAAVSLAVSARTVTDYRTTQAPKKEMAKPTTPAEPKESGTAAMKEGDRVKEVGPQAVKQAGKQADGHPLILVNGTEMPYEQFGALNPDIIKSIEVLKDDASKRKYGAKAKDGVILVETENHPNQKGHEPFRVSGKVTDENHKPVIGAVVKILGTKKGTVSDMDGNFTIEAPDDATIEVAYIGMQSATFKTNREEMAPRDGANRSTTVVLKADNSDVAKTIEAKNFDLEVVINGNGTTLDEMERTVKAEDIKSISVDKTDPQHLRMNVTTKK